MVKTKSCPLDPHHIHIVGDTKIIRTKQYTPDGTMIGQVMHYLKKLTNNLKKSYMFGFIIAPKAMIFIKYIVVPSEFQISDTIPIKEGLKLLKKLINMYNNNEPIFIDWAFSTKKGVKSEYLGTLSTASDRILLLIKENTKFSVSKSDELESLVKTFLLTKFSYIAKVIRSSERDPLAFLYNWNLIWNLLKDKFPVFNSILKHAKKVKYFRV